MSEARVDTTSSDYDAMAPLWRLADDQLGGIEKMRAAGETYLPKFEAERDANYKNRLDCARFGNVYADVLEGLARKPFAEPVKLADGTASPALQALAGDIDGRGRSIHEFASEIFHDGLHHAVDWILVDHTKARLPENGRPLSVAEEREQGLRPYWVKVAATDVIRVRSDWVAGEEVFTHFAYRADTVIANGYGEAFRKRICVYEREPIHGAGFRPIGYTPATYRLFEQQLDETSGRRDWVEIDAGSITLGEIPVVPFQAGRRIGGSWRFTIPLKAVLDAGVDLYRLESDLAWATQRTAFPMLNASGVTPEKEGGKIKRLAVGPGAVLYAPPTGDQGQHGEWSFIEPAGTSLNFLAAQAEATERRMRELGRQPLVTANLTVLTAAMNAQKANSAIEAWALGLQSALEAALQLTARWLGEIGAQPKVEVHHDFDADLFGATDVQALLKLRDIRPDGGHDISRLSLWRELKRRGVLSPNFDPSAEQERLDDEAMANIVHEADLIAASTPDVPIRSGGQE